MKFAIHVIGLNRIELTRKCLESIALNSKAADYHLILTNNGSTDGTKEFFDKLEHDGVTVIHNATNEGFIGPNNKAFEIAKKLGATYYLAVNNDCEVPEGWLQKLAAPLDADPLGALSGPEGTCNRLHANMDGYPGEGEAEYIEGSCLCTKISIVSTQGPLFSTYLDFIYGDDSDLSLRMREAGYHIYQVPFKIKHVQCATTHDPAVRDRCKQAQQHNHKVGMKRWAHYLRERNFSYPLVVKRGYAIGDVILTTPIIAGLKSAYPERKIWLETDFPEVFANNPHVDRAQRHFDDPSDCYPTLDLNGAYEKEVKTHILDAYRAVKPPWKPAYSEDGENPRLYPSALDRLWARNLAVNHQFSPKVCVMHADPTDWPGKRWPLPRYAEIAKWLVSLGFHVVAVGTTHLPPGFCAYSLIRKTSLLQLAALCEQSSLFIGGDSAPMHIALASKCPTVAIFGVTQSKFIAHGKGARITLDAAESIPCAGSRHRVIGKEHISCSKECIESHSVDDVKEAVRKLGVL